MNKLRYMEISVYGHDLDSFCNITVRGEAQYERLIENLTTLERLYRRKPEELSIVVSMRTYRSFRFNKALGNALLDIIDKPRQGGILIGLSSQVDNWGGAIDESYIADIEMGMSSGRYMYRKGPCGLSYDSIQITAAGKISVRLPAGTREAV